MNETTKKTLGIRSIAIDRIEDLQLTGFIRSEGESIELV
ncbi:hypothetical protein J2Z76_002787 [Sedimentibacter acidaminivorans]|uniref:Uncharacterized protein n=1 Tax=Sedimentibacter acidaminivorans TaxID=913099 RepID=A0ABS4GGU4_9FIRM|nr:hypothetical protein [Sedimentibacter acidaminivorans]